MSKISRKIIALSLISSTILGVGYTSALTLDEMYKQAYDYTMIATNKGSKHKVKPYYDPKNGGVTETEFVANAVEDGMQLDIMNAREKINALPESLLQAKRTFSSILDNYQHPVYERAVATLEGAKINPNQKDLNLARTLIKDIPLYYKSCYSSTADIVQNKMFMVASSSVDTATITKKEQDILKAKSYINELKTNKFMTKEIQDFINSLTNRLITQTDNNNNNNNNNNNQDYGVVFKDLNLEKEIRKAINKPTGAITKEDALSVSQLYLGGKNIKDISGIENFKNLMTLDLGVAYSEDINDRTLKTNSIIDITPLSNLTNLKTLILTSNKITNVYSLKDLVKLESLGLASTEITNINDLSNLTNLKTLFLGETKITSLDVVKNFKNLEFVSIPNTISNEQMESIKSSLPNCTIYK